MFLNSGLLEALGTVGCFWGSSSFGTLKAAAMTSGIPFQTRAGFGQVLTCEVLQNGHSGSEGNCWFGVTPISSRNPDTGSKMRQP